MKNQTTMFMKQVWTAMAEVLRSKTNEVKRKAGAVRTRLIILSLLTDKKFLFSNISHKFNTMLIKHEKVDGEQLSQVTSISHKFRSLFGPSGRKAEVRHKISKKIHALIIGNKTEEVVDDSKAIVIYSPLQIEPPQLEGYAIDHECYDEEEDDDHGGDYPDLTHCLFDCEDLNPNLSVVEIVKQSRESDQDFVLEDEIDQVADLFIRRFHRQMRMQKQLSLKMYEDMLDRSA